MKLLMKRQNQGPGNSGSPGSDDNESTATSTITVVAPPAAIQPSTSQSFPTTATIVEITTLAPSSTTPPLASSVLPTAPTSASIGTPTSNTASLASAISASSTTSTATPLSTTPTSIFMTTSVSSITESQSVSDLVTSSTSPTPSTTTVSGPAAEDEDQVNVGIIVGGVVGAFCLAAVIFIFWRYYSRRHCSDSDPFDMSAAGRRRGRDEQPRFRNRVGLRTVELPAEEIMEIGGRHDTKAELSSAMPPARGPMRSRHRQARSDAGEMWAGGIGHELAGAGAGAPPTPLELPGAAHEPLPSVRQQRRRVDGNVARPLRGRPVSSPPAGSTGDGPGFSFTTPSPVTAGDRSPAVGAESKDGSNDVSPSTPHTKNSPAAWGTL